MEKFLGAMITGMLIGFAFGTLMGMSVERTTMKDNCRKGWHWKDVNYSYSCTANERP